MQKGYHTYILFIYIYIFRLICTEQCIHISFVQHDHRLKKKKKYLPNPFAQAG